MTTPLPESYLTDEQCDEFRRLPCSFRDMVRQIYMAGYQKGALPTAQNDQCLLVEMDLPNKAHVTSSPT